jgi:hypothetical protein
MDGLSNVLPAYLVDNRHSPQAENNTELNRIVIRHDGGAPERR